MLDLDALADGIEAKHERPCWVCSLPESDRLWVDKVLKDGTRSIPTIAGALKDKGHAMSTEHRIKGHKYKHVR